MGDKSYSVKRKLHEISLWRRSEKLLERIDIELTERCNNNCIHCCINLPVEDRNALAKELTTDQIKSILNEAASLGYLTVRYTGGEPILRDDFEELYLYARRLGLKVMLFTNATLITPHLAKLFSRFPPLEKIEVTVYGMNRGSYEAVSRIPGSYEAAWRGINLLLNHSIPFVVKGAILPPNKHEMDDFEMWTKSIPWMDVLPQYSLYFDLRCRRDSEEKNRLIRKLRISPEESLRILCRDAEMFHKEMKQFCSKFMGVPGEKLFSCGAGRGGGCVDAYGKFQLCLMLRHPDTVYDLKTGSLEDAHMNFFPKIREKTAKNPVYMEKCALCFLKGLCEQCPAKSWMEFGTLDDAVDYFCEIAHAKARYLGLLTIHEKAWEVKEGSMRIQKFAMRDRAISLKNPNLD